MSRVGQTLHLVEPGERVMRFLTTSSGVRYVGLADVMEYLRVCAGELEGSKRPAAQVLNQAVVDLGRINQSAEEGDPEVTQTQASA